MRLDRYLVEKGFVETRSKALQLIKGRQVKVNGKIVKKGGVEVSPTDRVEVEEGFQYVGRGGYKLAELLEIEPIEMEGKIVLDVGSSTGGFTQVALQKGAKKVVAVDVGRNQLHPTLKKDPRVESIEETDIRDFTYPHQFPVVITDVSFISLTQILPALDRLTQPGGTLLLLFKPQFEVGKEAKRNSRGVVIDEGAITQARRRFEGECKKLGWQLIASHPSPITGKEGNREFGYWFRKEKKFRPKDVSSPER